METEAAWIDSLRPKLEVMDNEIGELESRLNRLREMRHNLAMLIQSAEGNALPNSVPYRLATTRTSTNGKRLTARGCLTRVLREAGQPLAWGEVQRRVSEFPNPPTPGALTSAFYHNTKGGSHTFLALGRGYAGLAGRDEGWEPNDGRVESAVETASA
jgi:hypothetical protein